MRGIRISLYRGELLVARGDTDGDGRVRELGRDLAAGSYRLVFEIAGPLFETVSLDLKIEGGHYHVPLLVAPFGCVVYRGS